MILSDIVPPDQWRILVESDEKYDSEIAADFVKLLTDRERANWISLLEMASQYGPKEMPSNTRHHIDRRNDLYEFIKGNFRLSFFVDSPKMVICCHLFRKKTQKTPESEKKSVIRLRKRYLTAKEEGKLRILDYEEE
ncbi:type II toxin-antitoxin system RelE/ParE family toxin [Microbulbifer sp. SSSA005]|uniref:type II toxin-antitoxin system RelE/ParE family toxin n=1 Tax=Microbulbifer sp. SSSA005 TaxID=3243378 RepID=UPI00403A183D